VSLVSLHWLHSISDLAFTHLSISAKRGCCFILPGPGGTIVHDPLKSYYRPYEWAVDAHALCGRIIYASSSYRKRSKQWAVRDERAASTAPNQLK